MSFPVPNAAEGMAVFTAGTSTIPGLPILSAQTPQTQTVSNGAILSQAPPTIPSDTISADEIALYDRQIRLWGMKAQERIRSANILIITMKALANEIAKNLVLAGIGSLTVVDHEIVTEADLGAQFFLSAEDGHLGMNRAVAASAAIQRLNPRVKVNVDTLDIRTRPANYFAPFDIVIATDLDADTLEVVNTATRINNRAFYAASSHGMYGFIFADLIEHDYVIERNKSNMATALGPETRTRSVVAVSPKKDDEDKTELVTKRELYSTWMLSNQAVMPDEILKSPRRRKAVTPVLSCLRALFDYTTAHGGNPPNSNDHGDLVEFTQLCSDKHKALGLPTETLRSELLRSFLQNIGAEIAPVTAVLGGQLAQDVINVLGQTQQPIQNFVVFDGTTMEATVYAMHPADDQLGKALLPLSTPVDVANISGAMPNPAAVTFRGDPSAAVVPIVEATAQPTTAAPAGGA